MTLVEIAVATALSMVVLTAVLYAYLSMRTTQRFGTQLAQTQGNGRVALEQIGRDIRQAGFIGCNSALQRHVDPRGWETSVVPIEPARPISFDNFTIDAQSALRVFPGNAGPTTLGGSAPAGAVADSHVIEVRYASLDGATRLARPISADGLTLATMGRFEPSRGDTSPQFTNRLGLLSDCQSAVIVSAASITADQVVLHAQRPLTGARCGHASRVGSDCLYWPSTSLYPIRVVQYYVADQAIDGVVQRALMMRTLSMRSSRVVWEPPQVLLVGATSLRVTGLGLDNPEALNSDPAYLALRQLDETTNGADFLPPVHSPEWRRVVRVDLRLRMQPGSHRRTAGDTPVIRNFESSFTIRPRVSVDP
jgi:hypothetical protein